MIEENWRKLWWTDYFSRHGFEDAYPLASGWDFIGSLNTEFVIRNLPYEAKLNDWLSSEEQPRIYITWDGGYWDDSDYKDPPPDLLQVLKVVGEMWG